MRVGPAGVSWSAAPSAWIAAAAGAALTAAIYYPALDYYLFADDFQWLAGARSFEWARLVALGGRNHFYRPALEVYFAGAFRGCGLQPACLHGLNLAVHILNIALVARLAAVLFRHAWFALIAALVFAALPAYTEGVLWVSAVGELLATTFVLATVILFVEWLDRRRASAIVACTLTFALALLTHETAAVLLPLLLLVAFSVAPARRIGTAPIVAFALIVCGYLAVEYAVNRQSYLVVGGHYRIGWHIAGNIADGISRLYVGRHDPVSLTLGAGAVAAFAIFGSGRLRMAAGWILIALVPASLFVWGPSSRYLYLPGVGFAILLAELLRRLHKAMRPRGTRAAFVVATAATLLVGVRFASFGRNAVRNYEPVGTVYRRLLAEARRAYPQPAPGATLVLQNPDPKLVEAQYAEAMVRLEYGRPDLRVTLVEGPR